MARSHLTLGTASLELHPSGARGLKADDFNNYLDKVQNHLGSVYNILDYGASEDATAEENYEAIQAAIDAAGSGTIFVPPGTYDYTGTLRLRDSGAKFFGVGAASVLNRTGSYGKGLIIGPEPTALPLGTALATGAGQAFVFPTDAATYRHYINLSQGCQYKENLNGVHNATVRLFYKPAGTINSQRCLMAAIFQRDTDTAVEEYLVWSVMPDGTLQLKLNVGGVVQAVSTSGHTLTPGTTYHLAWTYDNVKIRIFVNGVNRGEAAVSGNIVWPKRAELILGSYTKTYNENIGQIDGPMGTIDSISICRNYPHYTSNFTPPTTKHTQDFATVLLLNFDDNDGLFMKGLADLTYPTETPAWFVFQTSDDAVTFGSGGGVACEVGGLTFNNGGIFAFASIQLYLHDLYFSDCTGGAVNVRNNCFESKFHNINAANCSPVMLVNTGASGVNSWKDVITTGTCDIGFLADTSGVELENFYPQGDITPILLRNDTGGTMSATLVYCGITDEQRPDTDYLIIADNLVNLVVVGGTLEMEFASGVPVRLLGDTPASFIGVSWNVDDGNIDSMFELDAARTTPARVIDPGKWLPSTTPWCADFPNSVVEDGTLNALHAPQTGTAAPVAGAWRKGNIVWNSNPSAGGYVGWICTAAGTPGTWKGFGAIQS